MGSEAEAVMGRGALWGSGEGGFRKGVEGRMSSCNMAIEVGARAGLIAPDEVRLAVDM